VYHDMMEALYGAPAADFPPLVQSLPMAAAKRAKGARIKTYASPLLKCWTGAGGERTSFGRHIDVQQDAVTSFVEIRAN
jgi:hypothetical protein